ncbi:ABC transporter substrate-binding protein [Sanguibacter sp. Z1732]|uniref:ABC transporter substrate-binding protein n=1 Tax=Sanguibacter sp. Z1732 TaxID=3435412 RepID=UPI003D9C8FED
MGLRGSTSHPLFNLSHEDEAIRDLFNEHDFRVALSLAIDRQDLNDTLLGGLGEIRQPIPTEASDYYIEGGGQQHLDHDVDEANRLLDGLGLERGANGMRTLPDGSPLSLVVISRLDGAGVSIADVLSRVVRYWAEVGIDLTHQPMDNTLYTETYMSNDFDIDLSDVFKTDNWDLEPVWYVPISAGSHSCPAFGQWYESGGTDGIEPTDEFKDILATWERLIAAPSDEERIEAGRQIVQQHEDNLYVIGIIAPAFQPVIVSNDIRNVRDDEPILSYFHGRELFTKPEQLYFTDGT